jgi:hypothetical protein
MTGTLHPSCPLCGLRFGSRPLLDLHIREDHRQRGHRDPGDAQKPTTRAGSTSRQHDPASTPLRTTKEVTATTAAHRPRPGSIMPSPGRVIHALRYANDELTRAFEAIIRSARAPQPRPRGQATAAGSRDTAAERADQAA